MLTKSAVKSRQTQRACLYITAALTLRVVRLFLPASDRPAPACRALRWQLDVRA